jgi:hypothetical protein
MAAFDFRATAKLWNHSYGWNSVCGVSTDLGVNDPSFGLALDFFLVNFFQTGRGGMSYGGL